MNIQEYWVGLCQSYINFKDSHVNNNHHEKLILIMDKIKYINLVNSINVFNIAYKFIIIFGCILMTNRSLYANELLITNIKRLNKLINKTYIEYTLQDDFIKFSLVIIVLYCF